MLDSDAALTLTQEGTSRRHILPGQTRPLQLYVKQSAPLDVAQDALRLAVVTCVSGAEEDRCFAQQVSVPLRHRPSFHDRASAPDEHASFVYTYRSPFGTIDYAAAIPPRRPHPCSGAESRAEPGGPVLLGLHGAGVDAADAAWAGAFVRREREWTLLPAGTTGWGYDWQARTLEIATAALDQQAAHLYGLPPTVRAEERARWAFDARKVAVVGHSNGGQGAAHFITQARERVIGGVIVAGYVRVSGYRLLRVFRRLSAELTRCSALQLREYVSQEWHEARHHLDARLDGVLRMALEPFENDRYAARLAGLPLLWKYGAEDDNVPPHHMPTMHALVAQWNAQLGHPRNTSRLARVEGRRHWWAEVLKEDDVLAHLERVLQMRAETGSPAQRPLTMSGSDKPIGRKRGPMIRFLESDGPIVIVVPTLRDKAALDPQLLSIALRFAADSWLYGRIDVEIVSRALFNPGDSTGNVLFLETPGTCKLPHLPPDDARMLCGHAGTALLSLVPVLSPSGEPDSRRLGLYLSAQSHLELELGSRLLPVRTGTPVPEFIVLGRAAAWQGAGAALAAGWFDEHWQIDRSKSFLTPGSGFA